VKQPSGQERLERKYLDALPYRQEYMQIAYDLRREPPLITVINGQIGV
jgi:hypothetical protein